MKWEWEAMIELPITSPYQRYGNWETADSMRFFCQCVDACPARMRSAATCFVTLTTNVPSTISTISTTLPFSVDMFLCLYSPCVYLSES